MINRSIFAAPDVVLDQRPRGSFERLVLNDNVTVKIIIVAPNQRLSLQQHSLRDEWWTVLDQGLNVKVGDRSWLSDVGERIWIPRGTRHRVGNACSQVARFLELAFGVFEEEDIERLADDYRR